MALPQYDHVIFAKAPLSMVIGQVKFPILPRFGEPGFIATFHEALSSEYPRVSRERQIALQLSVEEVKPSVGEMLWRFADRGNRWSVVAGENAVTMEAQGYSSIDDFLSRFEHVLSAAASTLGISERTRLGLRYINEIRHPNARTLAHWKKLMNPAFLDFAIADVLAGEVERTLAEMQIRRSDGMLTVRHGLLSGTAVRSPMEMSQPAGAFYLVDLDYYDTSECDLDVPSIIAQTRAYNDTLYRFFRWTLSEELFDYMEPQHAGD